jgi:hypothetical protein
MKYAKKKLGIKDAALYVASLQENRLGPDILSDADLEVLTSSKISIPYGDALRLRKAALSWWSSHSKRPCEDVDLFFADGDQNSEPQGTQQGTLHLCAEYPVGISKGWGYPNGFRVRVFPGQDPGQHLLKPKPAKNLPVNL